MEKMYLVIQDWSVGHEVEMASYQLFRKYEDANEYLEKIKEEIKSRDYGWDEKDEMEDYYCEYVNGEYIYNHDLVRIEEMEVR